jgi:hypothetical protein
MPTLHQKWALAFMGGRYDYRTRHPDHARNGSLFLFLLGCAATKIRQPQGFAKGSL